MKNMNSNTTQTIKPKTKIEFVRIIRIEPCLYRTVRSFVESSLSSLKGYPWRIGYRLGNGIFWQKENKWRLSVFLDAITELEFVPLAAPGVYMIRSNQIPIFAKLQPLQCKPSLDFVVINGDLAVLPPISIPYKDKDKGILTYGLALARTAPFVFLSETVPFARPIFVREIIDTLNEYVEIS